MKACVVTKTSKLDVLLDSDPSGVHHLAERDPHAYAEMLASASTQHRSNATVAETLARYGIDSVWFRRDFFSEVPAGCDVVIVVGGDGTVLDVSHRVFDLPVIAINSDPARSVGYYSACTSDDLGPVLEKWLEGTIEQCTLARLRLTVDGEQVPWPCLNDILVCNENPCMMSRYVIMAGQRSEKQSSSGLWISTAAGSTAGIRSAGGTVMPLEGALIQYLIREPYVPRGVRYELLRGVRHLREGLRISSLMPGGRLYIDGPWMVIPFGLGALLELSEGPPFRILGMDPAVRER